VARKRLTGIGIGTPVVSGSLSWGYVGSEGERGARRGCLALFGGILPAARSVTEQWAPQQPELG
jgi:hypothetical protein